MADTFFVSLNLESARETAEKAVVSRSWTGELIDQYSVALPDGRRFVQMVYEKYYLRLGSSLTLTVTLDDVTGKTRSIALAAVGKGRSWRTISTQRRILSWWWRTRWPRGECR